MKRAILLIPSKPIRAWLLLIAVLLATSCSKEKNLEPSNLDEDYFAIQDNPEDPVDHAIYRFYQSTGIGSFYNDTIHRKQVGDSAGTPVYAYVKLSLSYAPFGNSNHRFKLLSSRAAIPALLDLLKEQLIPQIPENMQIPSILLVDSFWNQESRIINIQLADGWSSFQGFNTLAIKVEDVTNMNAEEQRLYIASILAGLAAKQIGNAYASELQRDFYSVSRSPDLAVSPYDIYIGLPFFFLMDPSTVPPPEAIGFLKYISVDYGIPIPLYQMTPPLEADDLRAYLCAAFYYSTQEFNSKYADDEWILQKFSIIRNIAKQAGFRLPD